MYTGVLCVHVHMGMVCMPVLLCCMCLHVCGVCSQVCCAVCVHGHGMCVHYCAVCVHGCGVCTGRETQGSSMNPPSGGEGRWRKVALTWMAMFLPSAVGRGHPGCCDICTREMSISPGQVRVGLSGGWCQAGCWSLCLHDESLCLSEPFGASLSPPCTAMAPSSPSIGPTCPPSPAFCCLILLAPGWLLAFGPPATEIQRREVN